VGSGESKGDIEKVELFEESTVSDKHALGDDSADVLNEAAADELDEDVSDTDDVRDTE
jgi:hypothetical protein